jgi:HEAT repeat protein
VSAGVRRARRGAMNNESRMEKAIADKARVENSGLTSRREEIIGLKELFLVLILLILSILLAFSPVILARSLSDDLAAVPEEMKELDRVLNALETFDHSQGEGPSIELDRLIFRLKDNPELKLAAEKKLLEFFSKPVSLDACIAISKPLSWIAGSESIKILKPHLIDPEKSDPARFVLERIPGGEADRVLIESLEKSPAEILPGIISSLGHRKAAAAVPYFEKLLSENTSPLIISITLEALGNIDDDESVRKILGDYLKSTGEKIRLLAADSLLRLAGREIEARKYLEARQTAGLLLKSRLTPGEKQAAWKVKILAAGENYQAEIESALKSQDEQARQAALGLLPELVTGEDIDNYLPLFLNLPEEEQLQVAAILSGYSTAGVRKYLVNLAEKSGFIDVRIEAVNSLGRIGESSEVDFLVRKAATAKGKEKIAARESLAVLPGKGIDSRILELLGSVTDEVIKKELLLAACERNIPESRVYFLKQVANPASDATLISRGLRAFGDISLAEELLPIVFKTEDEAFQEGLINILAAWAKESARPEAQANYFQNLLSKEERPERQAVLLAIVGKIGERNTLPVIRTYIRSQDKVVREAAVRALCDWPEVEARDDLLEIARNSQDLKEKVWAIRGLVRLAASERYRKPEAVVESLKEIYSLCPRAEEKKFVLSVMPDFPCNPGLEFCQFLLNDPEVGSEAKIAMEKIRDRLAGN